MKIIRKTAIVMLLCLYFLTYGVLPQVQAAGKDAPVIVVAHRAGAKVAPENTVAALESSHRMERLLQRLMCSSCRTEP